MDYNVELIKITNLPKGYDLLGALKEISQSFVELKNKYQGDFTTTNIENSLTESYKLAPYSAQYLTGTAGDCKHPWGYA